MPRTLTEQIDQTLDDITEDLGEDFKPGQLDLTRVKFPTKKDRKDMSIPDALYISAMRQSLGDTE